MKVIVKCKCGKEFKTTENRIKNGRGKFCSQKCKYKYKLRPSGLVYIKHKENPTSFKKGIIPWNKETIGLCKANKTSIRKGERKSIATEFKSKSTTKKKRYDLRKIHVDYYSIHDYIRARLGKIRYCSKCNTTTAKLYVWHNIDKKYRKSFEDWQRLCQSCHAKIHSKLRKGSKV